MLVRTQQGGPDATLRVVGLPDGYAVGFAGAAAVVGDTTGVSVLSLAAPSPTPLVLTNDRGVVLEQVAPELPWAPGDTVLYLTPMGAWYYDKLPAMMQERDRVAGYPLRQLLAALGAGLQPVRDSADDLLTLIDVDTCPAEYLPLLGEMLGFEFPYDLEVDLQRNFVRNIVALYRIKGTPTALRYVVNRLIAGRGLALDIANENLAAKTFDVVLTAEDDGADSSGPLQQKVQYLIGLYTPAGLLPTLVFLYFQTETFDATRTSDAVASTTEFTRWSFTMKGHTLTTRKPSGAVVSYTNLGEQPLDI